MTQAVVEALEGALAREKQPMRERVAEIARKAARLGDPKRRRTVSEKEVDALWGNDDLCRKRSRLP